MKRWLHRPRLKRQPGLTETTSGEFEKTLMENDAGSTEMTGAHMDGSNSSSSIVGDVCLIQDGPYRIHKVLLFYTYL